jgi:lactoylglutathione lyase
MKIHHVAIWTRDIERMKDFYVKYFNCKSNNKYCNTKKEYESYFLEFSDGAQLELMKMSSIPDSLNNFENQHIGLIHFAVSVGSRETVDSLTEQLRADGYKIVSNPRQTGDGFYESCALDPENNRIEITI